MKPGRLTKTELLSLIAVSVILGPVCYGLNLVFLRNFGTSFVPAPFFFMVGPMMKTIFFATVQREEIPVSGKIWVLISFMATTFGMSLGTVGCLIRNAYLGSFLIALGLAVTLLGFMPLQKIAKKSKEVIAK